MKKIVAINASPRPEWNTGILGSLAAAVIQTDNNAAVLLNSKFS